MAVQLFQVCNDKADVLMAEYFFYFYELWQKCEDAVRLSIYYNIRVKKYVYINGSRKNQLEIVDFLANDVPTGFGNRYTKALRNKIKHIRANVRYYE